MTARILMALTSHSALGNTGRTTGYYVPEAAHPLAIFHAAGFDVDFVSPAGGRAPADGGNRTDEIVAAFLDNSTVQAQVNVTHRSGDISPASYNAIFYVGGHGTMWDFPDDAHLASAATSIYERGGVVSAVCHGPAGLVNVKLSDGEYLVAGKTVSAFTNAEEAAVNLTDVVPFLLESRLIERGALVNTAPNFTANVSVAERLVTGQNPASARGVAEAVVSLLRQAA
jgi:putative intracellular protease/amidase